MDQTKDNLIANPPLGVAQRILQEIQNASKTFQIVSLTRQIEVCQDLFAENPFIDVAILGQFKAGKSEIMEQALEHVRNELSTIDALVSQTGGKTDEIHRMRKQLSQLLEAFGTDQS